MPPARPRLIRPRAARLRREALSPLGAAGRSLCVLLLALGAVTASGPAGADTLGEIRARGAVRVAVLDDAPPYSFRDDKGMRIGLEPALAQALADLLGVRLQLIPVDVIGRIDVLLAGQADVVLAGLPYNPRIAQVAALIHPPYYASGTGVLARKSERFARWTDLAGVPVCTIQGAVHNQRLAGDFGAELIEHKAAAEAYEGLIAGRCRAFAYTDSVLATLLHREAQWRDYEMPLDPIEETPWVMATRPGDPLFATLLSGAALGWHRDGRLQALEEQWRIRPIPFVSSARDIYAQ